VLAWLQILASKNVGTEKLVTVEDIAVEHWAKYGRNYYARYDYEGVDKAAAEKMMDNMRAKLSSTTELGGEAVALADDFTYVDPVDGSTTTKQGIRVLFKSGSRFVFRLSGTGVEGATVRLYLEKYEEPSGELDKYVLDLVKPLAALALSFSDLAAMTGRTEPSVIT
jgi:phosphoglucomutase